MYPYSFIHPINRIYCIATCFCSKKYDDEVNDGAENTILKLAAVATLLLLDDLRAVADIWAGVKRYTWGRGGAQF